MFKLNTNNIKAYLNLPQFVFFKILILYSVNLAYSERENILYPTLETLCHKILIESTLFTVIKEGHKNYEDQQMVTLKKKMFT